PRTRRRGVPRHAAGRSAALCAWPILGVCRRPWCGPGFCHRDIRGAASALAAAVAGRERLTGRRARNHDQRNLAVPPAPAAGRWGSLRTLTTRDFDRFTGKSTHIVLYPVLTPAAGKGVGCNRRVINEQ